MVTGRKISRGSNFFFARTSATRSLISRRTSRTATSPDSKAVRTAPSLDLKSRSQNVKVFPGSRRPRKRVDDFSPTFFGLAPPVAEKPSEGIEPRRRTLLGNRSMGISMDASGTDMEAGSAEQPCQDRKHAGVIVTDHRDRDEALREFPDIQGKICRPGKAGERFEMAPLFFGVEGGKIPVAQAAQNFIGLAAREPRIFFHNRAQRRLHFKSWKSSGTPSSRRRAFRREAP